MTTQDTGFKLELSRRKLIAAAGIGAGAVRAASLVRTGDAEAAPPSSPSPDPVATPPVAGLHLQFGADASSEMVVSWQTLQSVRNPRVVLGRLDGALERQRGQLHRCKIRPGCLRLSCEDQSAAALLSVFVWGFPRRCRAGIRHVPDLS